VIGTMPTRLQLGCAAGLFDEATERVFGQ
jgi:hypothetical protein